MTREGSAQDDRRLLTDVEWEDEYRTSSIRPGDQPTDILKDFYIPVLGRTIRYDRMAGYFRSSSLAAASQGFTALIRNGGKARFIVGCDLERGDVEAALRGADEALIADLSEQLEKDDSWDAATVRGVDLLAYMIAKGSLEIKVAFRVHSETGDPLSVDATSDGYVHEKWAIFTDADGNCIRIDGSLNESKTALAINAENISLTCNWWDARSKARTEKARKDFEHLWRRGSPGIRVLDLPSAVKSKLIRIGEQVFDPAEIKPTSTKADSSGIATHLPPLDYLRWQLISEGPRLPGGVQVGIETAPVTPWPHQEFVARRIVDAWPLSFMLCDEVGLGKTIEAGLAIRSLMLSGLVDRAMIAAPASLTRQWQRELASKFLLDFARAAPKAGRMRHERLLPDGAVIDRDEGTMLSPDAVIVSTGLLTHSSRRKEVRSAQDWDLVLVDEAHYARAGEKKNILYGMLEQTIRGKSKSLLLATATPMQLEMKEAFDLMRLTWRVGSFGQDDDVSRQYYGCLRDFIRTKGRLPTATLEFLRMAVREIRFLDPTYWSFIIASVPTRGDQRTVEKWIDQGRQFASRDWKIISRVLREAAPLTRVMLRHTRPLLKLYKSAGQLNANLAERIVLPLDPITFSSEEREVYEGLEDYCKELDQRITASAAQDERKRAASVGFYLSFLRLRFASSLFAINETLKRRRGKVVATLKAHQRAPDDIDFIGENLHDAVFDADDEDDAIAVDALLDGRTEPDLEWEKVALDHLITELDSLTGMPSKLNRLMRELNKRESNSRIRQTVVFTRFKDTLDFLVGQLRTRRPNARIGTFSGGGGSRFDPTSGKMINLSRNEIAQDFVAGEIDVLLCTDAAAEGLNLQTADLLINFDLPWNPAKVEQRIGRIDRIGQKYNEIHVINMAYAGSAEERVYGRLLSRLQDAGLIVGAQQIALIPIDESDFRILEKPNPTPEEFAEIEQKAKRKLAAAKQAQDALEIPPEELQEIYKSWQRRNGRASPVGLRNIEDALRSLADHGCDILARTDDVGIFAFNQGADSTKYITSSRQIFEAPPHEYRRSIVFASYGAPEFNELLEYVLSGSDQVKWCEKISTSISFGERTLTKTGFLVAIAGGQEKLITSCGELKSLDVDESRQLSKEDIEGAARQLARLAEKETRPLQVAFETEEANLMASRNQLAFSYEIAASYMKTGRGANDADDLHRYFRDDLVQNKREGMIVQFDHSRISQISPSLMPGISGLGTRDTNVPIPQPQLASAEPKMANIIKVMRRAGEEMYREEAARRLRSQADSAMRKR